jgi:hypothetical protein
MIHEHLSHKNFSKYSKQNSLNGACHTVAEVIVKPVNVLPFFMRLTVFLGELPAKNAVEIATNYLTNEEFFLLNRMVSVFFDLAEFVLCNINRCICWISWRIGMIC